jgi:hypothetical protein
MGKQKQNKKQKNTLKLKEDDYFKAEENLPQNN